MRPLLALALVGCHALGMAQSNTGKATTSAPCSPAITGSNNTVNLSNCEAKSPNSSKQTIPTNKTVKYRAIQLDKKLSKRVSDERNKRPGTQEGMESFVAAMRSIYPNEFARSVDEIAAELKHCGADTKQLEEMIDDAKKGSGPGAYFAIGTYLSRAAYDIPGGQPECGTKPVTSGFHDKDTGYYYVTLGSDTIGMSEDTLQNPTSPGTVYGLSVCQVYLIDGHLKVDATLYAGWGWPAVTIKRNEIVIDPGDFDRNYSDQAVEVINKNRVPMLQIVFQSDRRVTISGVFMSPDGKYAVIVTPTGNQKVDIDRNQETRLTVALTPIFKYPAWQHLGEYVAH